MSSEIHNAIKRLAKDGAEKIVLAEVLTVDKDKKLCSVKLIDSEVEYPEVRLTAVNDSVTKGFVLYPAKGSTIVIAIIDGSPEAIGIMFTDLESMEMIGKQYSIVKAEKLTTELNKMKATVDAIVNSLTGWTPVAQDGGAALKVFATGLLTGKTTGDYSDIKNDKIKHG